MDDDYKLIFPMIKKRVDDLLCSGYWTKSPTQKIRQERLNKLQALENNPSIKLENDIFIDGIQPINPLSKPIGKLLYIDYVYDNRQR